MCVMSFQGGGEQGSSAVLQDSQDFLRQMWRPVQNLSALPGKWRHTCMEMDFALATSPSDTCFPWCLIICVLLTYDKLFVPHNEYGGLTLDVALSCCAMCLTPLITFNCLYMSLETWGNIFDLLLNEISASFVGDKMHQSILNSFSGETRWPVSVRENWLKMETLGFNL